jgi:hypothetical protein
MSEPAPPRRDIESALEELAGRGYLGPSGPSRQSRWRAAARGLVLAVGVAVALGGAAAAAARVEIADVPLLVLGFLPVALLGVVVCSLGGRLLARLLLRAGGEPEFLASLLGGAAGLGVTISVLAVAAWDTNPGPTLVAVAGVIAVAMGVVVMALARRRLAFLMAFRAAPNLRDRASVWAFVVFVGGGVAFLFAVGRGPARCEPAGSFPPPVGRLAVVAVDGLSREDLGAAVEMAEVPGLDAVASWGWAPLRTGGSRLPAVLWTTIACGVGPSEHGVEELDEVRLFGLGHGAPLGGVARAVVLVPWGELGLARVVARPALARRAPTFWEMASRAGCPVTVGGWWSSWPVRRVLGEVASERTWLGGALSPDAVSAALVPLVADVWRSDHDATRASDALAEALARRAAATTGTRVVALSMPAADLVERARGDLSPLAAAALVLGHLREVGTVVDILRRGGFRIFVVAVPWRGGMAFAASSTAEAGRHPAVDAQDLASTWLDALGLPASSRSPRVRRDLSGMSGPVATPVPYGPPPAPLASPAPEALAVQREVLRNLGYLQ